MTTKHTPGEWRVRHNSVGGPFISSDNGTIADVRTFGGIHVGGPQHPETIANASLIAAAPDLLEFVAEWLSRQGNDKNYMTERARAAIAKATGESE